MSASQPRSTFVTVLAWISIVLSGFGTLVAILQNIMVHTLFNGAAVAESMQAPPPDAPPFAAFLLAHFPLFFLAFLLASAFALVSSIGLLRRWNWARLAFVGLMGLGIAWQLVGLGVQFSVFSTIRAQFAASAMQGGPDMQPFLIAMAIVGVLFAVGFSVLFGWIAKRLLSAPIALEFRQ
jgi:hypothetical protein